MTLLSDYQIVTLRPDPVGLQTPSQEEIRIAWEAHVRNCDEIKAGFRNYMLTGSLWYLADAISRLDVGNRDAMYAIAARIVEGTTTSREAMEMHTADSIAERWAERMEREPDLFRETLTEYNEERAKLGFGGFMQEQMTYEDRLLLGLWLQRVVETGSDPEKVKDAMRKRAKTRRKRFEQAQTKLQRKSDARAHAEK